jgi:hypothetical protein
MGNISISIRKGDRKMANNEPGKCPQCGMNLVPKK